MYYFCDNCVFKSYFFSCIQIFWLEILISFLGITISLYLFFLTIGGNYLPYLFLFTGLLSFGYLYRVFNAIYKGKDLCRIIMNSAGNVLARKYHIKKYGGAAWTPDVANQKFGKQ